MMPIPRNPMMGFGSSAPPLIRSTPAVGLLNKHALDVLLRARKRSGTKESNLKEARVDGENGVADAVAVAS